MKGDREICTDCKPEGVYEGRGIERENELQKGKSKWW